MTKHPAFENLGQMARGLRDRLGSMAVTFSKVDGDMLNILAMEGLTLPVGFDINAIPLTEGISQHVVAMNHPLIVDDALTHPLIRNNPIVHRFGICAYLGVPMRRHDGIAFGALAILERRPRRWHDDESELVDATARRAERLLNGAGTTTSEA